MDSLVIGSTSQLSYYFPEEYVRISSRDIDFNSIIDKLWDRIYVCVGESRKFLDDVRIYDQINFELTLNIIDKLKHCCRSLIIYSSCELWNQYDGPISLSLDFNFYSTPYLQSKYKLSKYILNNKEKYGNVNIIYSFNFNSVQRNNNFLFGKIFDSIINKKVVEIGDTYFYRDIIHPSYVISESIKACEHKLVGSGRLTFVNDFIRDLYSHYNLKYEDYVIENFSKFNEYSKRKEYYLKSNACLYSYADLLKNTIKDIDKKIKDKNDDQY
jgi:nucleoside-diphosphate-sugar epimerase